MNKYDVLVNVKMTRSERDRAKRAAEVRKTTLSDVIRAALKRMADRVEREAEIRKGN